MLEIICFRIKRNWIGFIQSCIGNNFWLPTRASKICCLHFEPIMFCKVTCEGQRTLEEWALPTIGIIPTPLSVATLPCLTEHMMKRIKRDESPRRILNSPPQFTSPPRSLLVSPNSRSRVLSDHNYHFSPDRAAEKLRAVQDKLEKLKKKYQLLKRKMDRRDKANLELKNKVEEYCSQQEVSELEDKFPDVLKLIISNEKKGITVKGKSGIVYDEEMRKFSATLHHYSPKCYDYLRHHLNLPHPNTITSWMRSHDCGPGFNVEVIKQLGIILRDDKKNVMKDVCLIIDEMAIKKELLWNPSRKKFEGHINYGIKDAELDPTSPLATSALVCMVSGLSGGWKVPIGYIFTDKADGLVQKTFVDKAFHLLEAEKFNVHALVSDGCTSNVSLFDLYGVKEKSVKSGSTTSLEDIVYTFPNPANPKKVVHVIYELVHMLKLWRNLLAQCGELSMANGNVVNWKYIEQLYVLQVNKANICFRLIKWVRNLFFVIIQDSEKIRAWNKLGKLHVQFDNHKMRVKLAAQALSKSVADAIVFCREDLKLPEFQGSEGTTDFIYLIDKVFDILNSRSPRQRWQKSAISRRNFESVSAVLNEFAETVLGMTYTETRNYKKTNSVVKTTKQLCQGSRKRAALGLIVSSQSILTIAKDLLYRFEDPFLYVMTYRFSQDLLELFFNAVRGKLGRNNNPTTLDFENIMKVIWHVSPLKSNKLYCPDY